MDSLENYTVPGASRKSSTQRLSSKSPGDLPAVKRSAILFAILISGLCWYLSFDLLLHCWWTLWLAPIPVLYLAARVSGWQAFGIAFLAFLIGRLSWLTYLASMLPMALVLVFTLFFPIAFALVVLAVRRIIVITPPLAAVFAYPVLWTTFEFLQFLFSRDGTIGSITYTQSDFLPLVQIASVTGVLGITFLVCLGSSAIALGVYYYQTGKKVRPLVVTAGLVIVLPLVFGVIRLSTGGRSGGRLIGLAAVPMNVYPRDQYDKRMEIQLGLARRYLQEVPSLTGKGVSVILLPEKGIPVSDSAEPVIRQLLQKTARQAGVTLIAGITRLYKDHPECQAWVISPEGQLVLNYRKVNLFEGEVIDGFVAGKTPGSFQLGGETAGVAICKDMDYDQYIRRYSPLGVSTLYVPAWDFNRDGWLHSRIAILRAVENGYSLVRNAQQGRQTISDDRGRVVAETNADKGAGGSLTGMVISSSGSTLYARWGNWWGWLNLVFAAGYLCWMVIRRFSLRKSKISL